MLYLSQAIREQIRRHAAEEYPRECCGILLGRAGGGPGDALIEECIRAENRAPAEAASRRYVIEPRGILAADIDARRRGLDIVGFYHSHPDHAAVFSAVDVSLGWSGYVYLIAAINDLGEMDLRAWQVAGTADGKEELFLR